jgi:PAS domain S-box-containing protein
MNPPINAANLAEPFTGWDELRPGHKAWRIEAPVAAPIARDGHVPFFPDQNGRVYEQMLANMPVMLHAMDGSGRITSVNLQWQNTLGYSQQEIAGRSFNELLSAESRQRLVQQIYPDYLQTGVCRSVPLTFMAKDGTQVPVLLSMNAYRGAKGRIERSVCMLVPEPVGQPAFQGEAEVPAPQVVEDRRFRGAFESAGHGMALVSPLGEITMANAAFWDFVGKPEGKRSGVSLDDVLDPGDRQRFLDVMGELIQGKVSSVNQDFLFVGRDERTMHGSTAIALLRSDAGEIEQIIVQIVDVTEARQTARQLQYAQKMEAIGQMTGGLAHDFNNLLTVVIGNLELLEGRIEGDEKALKRLSEAVDAARKGSDLTRQLLAFARKQALEPREVKLNELVSGIAPLIARSVGEAIQIKVETMAGEPKAQIDPSQLESAILNLAINARDAMEKVGQLTIETQPAYLDEAYAARFPEVTPGHYVMVAVSDTGGGMSPELLEKVFQPFFTTKEHGKGSGLGLAMVYGFIKQSGGHINIYSEVGHGTAVKMYLPRKFAADEEIPDLTGKPKAAAEVVPAEPGRADDAAAEKQPRKKVKILVVEDQEAVRAVACGFLDDFGYDVVEAEDGLQALARLQENPDIELLFSDVVMPGGLNGFDLAQAARGIRPDLKIVHTSGYPKGAMVHQEEPRFREGFIIMKPYRREDLQKIIADALELQE